MTLCLKDFCGALSLDFHTWHPYALLAEPFCPALFCTLLRYFCMLSYTLSTWHVLFWMSFQPMEMRFIWNYTLRYFLGCNLEGNRRARCFFSGLFGSVMTLLCLFLWSLIIRYQSFVEHEFFPAHCFVLYFVLVCIYWHNLVHLHSCHGKLWRV